MTELTRPCADCGIDISNRHGLAKRCRPCARVRSLEQSSKKPPTVYDRVCERCSEPFQTRVKRGRFCSTRCAGLATHPGQVDRTCVVCDTEFSVSRQYDRDVCSRPCKKWAQDRPGEKPVRECQRCGVSLAGKHLDARFCSATCSVAVRAVILGKTRRFYRRADGCLVCGVSLEKRSHRAQYCSHACQALTGHERRNSKLSSAPVEHVVPAEIFARDGWTCHICGGSIDRSLRRKHPQMASIDHVIPIDDPNYPGHIWENLATAHLRCNISKGPCATTRDWDLFHELTLRRHGGATWPLKRPELEQLPLFNVS